MFCGDKVASDLASEMASICKDTENVCMFCCTCMTLWERSWDSLEWTFRWQLRRLSFRHLAPRISRDKNIFCNSSQVFWLNFQNVSRNRTSPFTIPVWNVTFCFSVFFKEHPIDNKLGHLYNPWAILCSLLSPHPTIKHLHLLFSGILLHIPVFVRLLYFLVATISPFFQSQPQALPTREWHQTTCQEPFKIAARLQWHS